MKMVLSLCFLLSCCFVKAQTDTSQIATPDSAVYFNTEITPCFPLGNNAWQKYLDRNLEYPGAAKEDGIQGSVVVQFIVNKVGKTQDAKIISGPPALQKEALRLIKESYWVPGIQHGRKVNAWKTVSIEFNL